MTCNIASISGLAKLLKEDSTDISFEWYIRQLTEITR